MKTTKMFAVMNEAGKVFAGISPLNGYALWFRLTDDDAADTTAFKSRRDSRWLALALRSDPTAAWQEV